MEQSLQVKNKRESGIELLRILMMLVIIAHHAIVNSPVMGTINSNLAGGGAVKNLVAMFLGWGGKTAIDVFLLITGYFQCLGTFKWRKLLNIYLLMKFYRITIYFIFLFCGVSQFSITNFLDMIFGVGHNLLSGFTTAYLVLYAVSPFLNIWIKSLSKKQLTVLISILISVFCIIPTIFYNYNFEYFGWYITVYMIGAWLRLYSLDFMRSKKCTGIASLITLILSWMSIAVIWYASKIVKTRLPYYWFVNGEGRPLALLTAIFLFLFFNELKNFRSDFINSVAKSTLAVLLIHASSNTMRVWLWQAVCDMGGHFENDSIGKFVIHTLICTICVYIVCVLIDYIRRVCIMGIRFLWNKNKLQ